MTRARRSTAGRGRLTIASLNRPFSQLDMTLHSPPASTITDAIPRDPPTAANGELVDLRGLVSDNGPALAIFSDALASDALANDALFAVACKQAADKICELAMGCAKGAADSYIEYESLAAFLWELWTILGHVARRVPHNHPGQAMIVSILVELSKRDIGKIKIWAGEPVRLWQDLPLFDQRMVEIRNSPVLYSPAPGPLPEYLVFYWRNQCAFEARCLEAGVAFWDDNALVALSSALERDDWTSAPHLRCEILAATEWIIHSGPTLRGLAEENDAFFADGDCADDDDFQDIPPGPLFDGRQGLSVQRWDFWKARFAALLDQAADKAPTGATQGPGPSEKAPVPTGALTEDVCIAMKIAIEQMDAAERVVAETRDE